MATTREKRQILFV